MLPIVLLGGPSYVAGAKGVFVENAVCCCLSKVILMRQAFKQGKWSLSVYFCSKATLVISILETKSGHIETGVIVLLISSYYFCNITGAINLLN